MPKRGYRTFRAIAGWFAAGILLTACPCLAQVIGTFAGNDALFTGAGQAATAVQFAQPAGVAVDASGNVFIAAIGQAMILKVGPSGIISVAAGNGLARYSGDGGAAVGASLSSPGGGYPWGIAFDAAGNLYIADQANNAIRRVDPTGVIATVAGNGQDGFSGDGGPATKAALSQPTDVAIDKAGNLYIADAFNNRIRMVNPSGVISTVAGNGNAAFAGDGGSALQASFSQPSGLALDSTGNLFVADRFNHRIRKIAASGVVSTIAGNGQSAYSGDNGPAIDAALSFVAQVKLDSAGNIYFTDEGNNRIRRVDPTGIIATVAGNGQNGFSGDGGAAGNAAFSSPAGFAIDSTGALIVADEGNSRVRRVVPGGAVTTIAGQTLSIGDNGPSTMARFTTPFATVTDSAGNLYIADSGENRVRKVTPFGAISTIAGTGLSASTGNGGAATAAGLYLPDGLALDSAGNLYIADTGNTVIRKVNAATGVISAFAGNGTCCYTGAGSGGDGGPATAAVLFYPVDVALDAAGNVYITDFISSPTGTIGECVRRIATDGKINVYAGGGAAGFSGDGGPAAQAALGSNIRIAVAADGTLYIADTANNRIRRVDPSTQIIATIAGNGQATASGNGGPALSAGIPAPSSIAVDKAGNLYIGGSSYVRMVNTAGIVSAFAGNGQYSFSGDNGPATAASLSYVSALSVDASGNVYITDQGNERIRIVQPSTASLTAFPTSLPFTSGGPSSQTFAITASAGTLAWSSSASTASGGAWLSVSPASGLSPSTLTVAAKTAGLADGVYYGLVQIAAPAAANPITLVTVQLTIGSAGPAPPQISAGGVLSTASYSLNTPVAPGMLISIFGANLTAAGQVYTAPSYPLPTAMGGTSVTIGGELLPLDVVTPGQINAILPFDLPVNTTLPLVVTYNNAISAPEPVSLVADEPGIFTSTQNGTGLGIVAIIHPSGAEVLAGPGNAAGPGDTLVIYCTGLGDVTPRAVAGSPAPITPLEYVIDPVTVTIGGVNAPVSFAGPTPGFAGLYQVNVTVPGGVTASGQSPLVLTQSGRASPSSVTIAIQ